MDWQEQNGLREMEGGCGRMFARLALVCPEYKKLSREKEREGERREREKRNERLWRE